MHEKVEWRKKIVAENQETRILRLWNYGGCILEDCFFLILIYSGIIFVHSTSNASRQHLRLQMFLFYGIRRTTN